MESRGNKTLENLSFRKNPLPGSIALALGAVGISPVMAQTAGSEEAGMMEEVTVTGVRRSIIDATAIKRDSDGVVDAISAEDIGKFPDTNLAEAMSRITGVSIDRSSPGGAYGEGQRITVRGIGPDYNLVLLNGRQMPASTILDTSASTSRAFDFANLASEAVAGVDVYKTSMSNIPTGGIGATVNIRTARPLDIGDMRASVGVKGVYDDSKSSPDWKPEISGIYSNVFADGTFGVTLTGIYQERDFGYNQAATTSGWRAFKGDEVNWGTIPQPGTPGSENITNRPDPTDTYSVPQNILYSINSVNRERTNGQLVLQWRPVENITATLDYVYSEMEIQTKRNELSAWFNFGASESSWTDGPVAAPLLYREFYDGFPTDVGAGAGEFGIKNEIDSFGFNLEWDVRDNLGFTLDAHSSESEIGNASPYGTNSVLGGVGFYRGTTAVDFSRDFPVLIMDVAGGQIDPSLHLTGGASFRNSYMKSEIDQLDLSGYWDVNDASTLDFGVTYTDVDNRSAFSNVQYDNWGGIGSPDDYPDDLWQVRRLSPNFSNLPGHNSPDLFNQIVIWSYKDVIPVAEASRGQSLRASPDFTTDRRTNEETTSAYLQYLVNFDLNGMNSNLRAGIRYEDTDVTSRALVPIAEQILWAGDNEYNIVFGDPDFTQLEGSYDYWLPNLDFNIEVKQDLIVRASYSETIGRPGWGDIQGGQTLGQLVRVDGGTGQQGDPGLKPLESQNWDISIEWYYGEGSYASIGYFFKDVDNYVGITQITDTPFDLPHPGQGEWVAEAMAAGNESAQDIRQYIFATYGDDPAVNITGTDSNGRFVGTIAGRAGADPASTFDIQVPSNQESVEIDGFEIAWQHLFGDTGFGFIANYTYADADREYDPFSLESQFAIEGLSDSANLVAFYDKNDWIVRLAYNWRDDFLSARFDGNGLANPVYTDDYGQLDGIVSYTFENGVTLFAEAFNLTDEYIYVYGRTAKQTQFATQTGRRYGIGARWNF